MPLNIDKTVKLVYIFGLWPFNANNYPHKYCHCSKQSLIIAIVTFSIFTTTFAYTMCNMLHDQDHFSYALIGSYTYVLCNKLVILLVFINYCGTIMLTIKNRDNHAKFLNALIDYDVDHRSMSISDRQVASLSFYRIGTVEMIHFLSIQTANYFWDSSIKLWQSLFFSTFAWALVTVIVAGLYIRFLMAILLGFNQILADRFAIQCNRIIVHGDDAAELFGILVLMKKLSKLRIQFDDTFGCQIILNISCDLIYLTMIIFSTLLSLSFIGARWYDVYSLGVLIAPNCAKLWLVVRVLDSFGHQVGL